MKYFVFLFGFLVCVPLGSIAASSSRRVRVTLFALLVFSSALTEMIDINFLSREWYRSMSRGLGVSFVDLLTMILLLSTLISARRERRQLYWPASLGLMLIYFGYSCLSVATADPRIFGVLELWKMLRGVLPFIAVAWYVRSERDIAVFTSALGAVLLYEGGLVLWARYFSGTWRAEGTFPHPNFLAEYCAMASTFVLAMAFTPVRPALRWFWAVAWAFGALAVLLSISRMGLAVLAVGTVGVLGYAIRSQFSPARVAVVLCFALLGFGMVLRSYDQFASRHEFMSELVERGDGSAGRMMYYDMAVAIAQRHPLGIGLNNWSWWVSANADSFELDHVPYPNTREPSYANHAVFAHSLYALTLGELGWPGMLIFTVLWVQWLIIAGRNLFVRSPNLMSTAGVGIFFALVVLTLNNLTECNFRSQHNFIIANMLLGLSSAIWRMDRSRAAPVPGLRA